MSRILALAHELKAIRRQSPRRSQGMGYYNNGTSRALEGGLPYDFNAAYEALHAEDEAHVQQQSWQGDWAVAQDDALIFQDAVTTNTAAFLQRVRDISTTLQINPNWLMGVMYFESRLNHQAVNRVSGATGLIQFMPATARGMGTTTQALAQLTNVQQLDYVLRYYQPYRGRMHRYLDCYLVTFYPYAVGRPESFVLGSERSPERVALIARQNAGLDLNRDGQISVGEVRERLYRGLNAAQQALVNGAP